MIADDHAYINARMEQIKAERLHAPAEHAMQAAIENYLGHDEPAKEPAMYMGWDIYAPVNVPKLTIVGDWMPKPEHEWSVGPFGAGNSKTAACQNES